MFLILEPATTKDTVEVKGFEGGAVFTGSGHRSGRDAGDGSEVGVELGNEVLRERLGGRREEFFVGERDWR